MNPWTSLSIEYANQRSYLDDLFHVYPTIPDGIREIDESVWDKIESAFHKRKNVELLRRLLKLDLFPIKDSYIAFLKRDKTSIERNPRTVNRICGRIYELGLDKLYERCREPKETNRQIGPMFRNWLRKKSLGIAPVPLEQFLADKNDAILDGSDQAMTDFARQELNYTHDKGLDLVARFNGKYVIGEAKFLTDFGGHQNAQFNDAITTITTQGVKAVTVAVLDGVLYIKGKNKMYKQISETYNQHNIMSVLVLRDFLYQL
jgi:hypothetical protein